MFPLGFTELFWRHDERVIRSQIDWTRSKQLHLFFRRHLLKKLVFLLKIRPHPFVCLVATIISVSLERLNLSRRLCCIVHRLGAVTRCVAHKPWQNPRHAAVGDAKLTGNVTGTDSVVGELDDALPHSIGLVHTPVTARSGRAVARILHVWSDTLLLPSISLLH